MTGPTVKKKSDRGLTRRHKNRNLRKENLKDYLSNQQLVQKTIDIAKKLSDGRRKIDRDMSYRMNAAAQINLKLIQIWLKC